MKKLISLITVFILTSATAFASDAEDLAALLDRSGKLRSASVEMTVKADLNKPLDIISQIPDIEIEESDVDPQMMVESLIGTEMKLNGSYSVSEDYKQMTAEMYFEFDAPVRINENLMISAWSKTGMWLDYDMTDKEYPVYKIISKSPTEKRYSVIDMSGYFKENPDKIPEINADTIKELRQTMKKSFLDNAEIKKSDGAYVVKLTDKSAKAYIKDAISSVNKIVPEIEEGDGFLPRLSEFLDKVNIFGGDGVTVTVSPGADGYIEAETAAVNINMNVYDAIAAFDGNTKGLDRDKADIDLTVNADCKYTSNNASPPALPALKRGNSRVIDYDDMKSNYEDNGVAIWERTDGETPAVRRGNKLYFAYEDMARQVGLDLKTETAEDMTTISVGDGYHVDVKGNEVTLYGHTTEIPEPLISENGRMYCSSEFLDWLGIYVSYAEYDIETNSIKYAFYYMGLPDAPSEDADIEDGSADSENPFKDKSAYYVLSDRVLYLENDTAYVPIYDLLNNISTGEYTFRENGFDYTASYENALGINTVSVYTGSRSITVNGENKKMPYEAVDIDGVIRVPIAFAESIGLEVDSIRIDLFDDDTFFMFSRDYGYNYDRYENWIDYGKYDNWFYSLMENI